MEVHINSHVAVQVEKLIETGAFPTPESAVNALIARVLLGDGSVPNQRLPIPVPDPSVDLDIPDFPRGAGASLVPQQLPTSRLPDLIELPYLIKPRSE